MRKYYIWSRPSMGKDGRSIYQIMYTDKKGNGQCISQHRKKSIALKKLKNLTKR